MDIDIIKDNTLVSSLTDVQFQISKPCNENENGETYVTLTVMRKSELIAKIKVLTLKDGKKHRNYDGYCICQRKETKNVCFYLATNGTFN